MKVLVLYSILKATIVYEEEEENRNFPVSAIKPRKKCCGNKLLEFGAMARPELYEYRSGQLLTFSSAWVQGEGKLPYCAHLNLFLYT